MKVVGLFCFYGREVVAVLERAAVVEPVDPLSGRDLEILKTLRWAAGLDELGLVEPDDRLGQGVVIGRADSAGGRLDPGRVQVLGLGDRLNRPGF